MELIKTTKTEITKGFCDVEKKDILICRVSYLKNDNKEHVFEQVFYENPCFSFMRIFTLLELKKHFNYRIQTNE